MIQLLFFLLGMMIGGLVSLVLLCCLQVNRINEYEAEIKRLKEQRK